MSKLLFDAYDEFSSQWALVTAGNMADHNSMTVSWGGIGSLWGKPVATVYIRPNRHTYGYFEKNDFAFFGFNIDEINSMSSEELREEGVSEGTLIHMLGFPMGLVNETSPDPICRLGCIARMTAAQIQETQNILVDIQNFPGNSGSPIIVRPEILSVGNTKSGNKCVLLGIVHSYIPYQETLQNTQTKKIVEIRSENSGLAKVHPVEFIREVVDLIIALPSSGKSEESEEDPE